MTDIETSSLASAFRDLLKVKERLLWVALQEGTILKRDDPELLTCLDRAHNEVEMLQNGEKRQDAMRVLRLIRQFNPFNTSDIDENEMLTQVVEDFLNFSRDRIDKFDRSAGNAR